MSVYVPDYNCDVFVSYAAVDNQPLAGEETCWVTNLINTLKVRVAHKLGTQAYSLWIDYQSRTDEPLAAQLKRHLENLEKSATFILILSPGYLVSPECHKELDHFLRRVGNNGGRIFKIEYLPVELIPELKDISGYRFWKRDTTDRVHSLGCPKPNPGDDKHYEYYIQIDNLATDLVEKLKNLKKEIENNNQQIENDEKLKPKANIFLAEVSDDLSLQREELKRNLELQGFGVLPSTPYFFPNDEQKLCQAIDADLEKSVVFVQLLSQFNPWRPVGMSTPQLQYDRAGVLNKKILQWRNPNLDVNLVTETTYRTLLTKSTVMATGIVEFHEYLFRRLEPPPPPPPSPPCDLVFVNAEPNNIQLAQKIAEVLAEKHGLGYILPIEISGDITPTQLREDLETNLEFCSAVLVLYNHPHELPWLRNQLLYCHRIRSKRNSPFKVIVCDNQPPDDKLPPNVKFSDLHILKCVMPYHDNCVSCFIQVLRS
jgi:hypothetical protein